MGNFKRIGLLSLAALLVATPAWADSVIYNTIPSVAGADFPYSTPYSKSFQAGRVGEMGDYIQFAGTQRDLTEVTVAMVNYQGTRSKYMENVNGQWSLKAAYANCGLTTTDAGFYLPMTFNIYGVGAVNNGVISVGSTIASKTITAFIPWRPEDDPAYPGKWLAPDGPHNGQAVPVVFDFTADGVTLPESVIYGLSYTTQSYGPSGAGTGVEGPYNSLNFGLTEATVLPSVGTNITADNGAQLSFVDYLYDYSYATVITGVSGTFRMDTGYGYLTTVKFEATPEPCTMALLAIGGLAIIRRSRKTA